MPGSSEKNKNSEKVKPTGKIARWTASLNRSAEKILPGWLFNLTEPRWQRWALIVGAALLAAFITAPRGFQYYDLTVGEPAPEKIVSPITFQVIDESATNKNRDESLKSVLPVYDFDDEMVHDVQSRIISAFNYMRDYLAAETAFREKEASGSKEKQPSAETKPASKPPFRVVDEQTLRTRFENLLGANITLSSFSMLRSVGFSPHVERDLRSLVVPVLMKGVVQSRELVMRDGKRGILLYIKSKEKLEPLKDLSNIVDLQEAFNSINVEDKYASRDSALDRAIRRIAMDLVNVNIIYDRERSASLRKQALDSVKPVYFQVVKGEAIIKKGEVATEGHLRKLAGLNKANPAYSHYAILAGFALILILLLRLCFYFSERHLGRARNVTEDLLLFALLLIGTIVLVRFIVSFSPLLPTPEKEASLNPVLFAAPVATGAMLIALMVDARIAFIFSAVTALTATLAVEGSIYLFAFYFISGIVGLHGMSRITDRTSVLRAGLVVGVINMVSVLAIKMALGQLTAMTDFYEIGLGFLGGVISGLLVSGLAPLLEPLGYVTDVKLLEIANLNHPVLKEMALQAPGTYHHSITVGNLVEAAAESIEANPLLARVGALYHDIGKVGKKTKPTYFIENQFRGANPHDRLEPSMSSLILISHVKHGVEKAREYRLGAPIIDIIQQHHGSSLIKFFYNKALEKAEKAHQVVSEDKYHYPGPRPRTKEAALVMLADVAEAACRTLADPTPARIQKRVQTLVMGLFSEGQLDESTLTLKDLHAITRSFVRTLQGILHTRIDYPSELAAQEKPNGDLNRQQAEKDRHRPGRPAEENGTNIRRLGM
jgi:putative nucleotidyltransferase with HDIG domain